MTCIFFEIIKGRNLIHNLALKLNGGEGSTVQRDKVCKHHTMPIGFTVKPLR